MDLTPQILNGSFIRLDPITEAHRAGLNEAAQEDPAIFQYMPTNVASEFDKWFDWSLGLMQGRADRVFVVRDKANDRIVGTSRYLNISEHEPRVEIGYTWYRPSVQKTYVNPEAKLLLMQNAFETLGCVRVELKTDERNAQSRAAILKMGAKFEGILRKHFRMTETFVRNSVYYSVLNDEWPEVKTGLQARVDAFKAAS